MLCFAYGSNMSSRQMADRCPGAKLVGTAQLPGYRLAFTGFSSVRGGAVATVVPARGKMVNGLLWELPPGELKLLDRFEGCPVVYRRVRFFLICQDGLRHWGWVYLHNGGACGFKPAPGYLRIIRGAYRRHGFPREDIDRAVEEIKPCTSKSMGRGQ